MVNSFVKTQIRGSVYFLVEIQFAGRSPSSDEAAGSQFPPKKIHYPNSVNSSVSKARICQRACTDCPNTSARHWFSLLPSTVAVARQ